jgi:hypothetical protein
MLTDGERTAGGVFEESVRGVRSPEEWESAWRRRSNDTQRVLWEMDPTHFECLGPCLQS